MPTTPEFLEKEMEAVNEALDAQLLPPLIVEKEPVSVQCRVCVCMLARMSDIYPVRLEEGGRQMPHSVVLVLTPNWLRKEETDTGEVELYLSRGISMDAHGQARLMTYKEPRRVTYFLNLLTKAVTEEVDYGYDFELGRGKYESDPLGGRLLACPRSSSMKLEKLIGDKLLTRLLMDYARVAVPDTLAYVLKSEREYPVAAGAHVNIKHWESVAAIDWDSVREDVQRFVDGLKGKTTRVVVKPSGHLWMRCKGVTYHGLDVDSIVGAATELATGLHDGDSVLIEEYCGTLPSQDVVRAKDLPLRAVLDPATITETRRMAGSVGIIKAEQAMEQIAKNLASPAMPPCVVSFGGEIQDGEGAADELQLPATEGAGAEAEGAGEVMQRSVSETRAERRDTLASLARISVSVLMAFRIRVVVQRNEEGQPTVSKMVCAVGPSDEPLHGGNTVPQTLAITLQQWGFSPGQAKEVRELLTQDAVATFKAITTYEIGLSAEDRGGRLAATDCIGLDMFLTYREGVVTPVVIEINDHDCMRHASLLEDVHREDRGECMRAVTRNMLHKSQRYLQKGEVVVVVGAGGDSKSFVWDMFRERGTHVVLLEGDADHFARGRVGTFIHAPEVNEHENDLENAKRLVARLAEAGYTADTITGCMTYWEDCSPLAAAVGELLGTVGNPYEAHRRAKSKFLTHEYLATKRCSQDFSVAVPSIRVKTAEELEAALKKIPLPALLKMEHGSSAVGVILVETADEAREEFRRLVSELKEEEDHPGCGLSFAGPSMVLMEYVDGSEHQLDMLMFEGRLLFHAISDYSPTKLPYFNELAITMPSRLHERRQETMVYLATLVLRSLGLNTGAFNVGMKYTKRGPRLIEVNARMGGFCLRDWIRRLYGVDMAECAAMIACGQPPVMAVQRPAKTRVVGLMLYASDTAEALRKNLATLNDMHSRKQAILNMFESEIPEATEFEEPIANLSCTGNDFSAIVQTLCAILHAVDIHTAGGVPIEWYFDQL